MSATTAAAKTKRISARKTPKSAAAQLEITPTEIKIGDLSLPVIPPEQRSAFVPERADIIDSASELKTLMLAIKRNLPVLMIGDTGTGKTSMARYIAYLTGTGYRRLNLNGGTTNDELVGHYIAQQGSMEWIDGVLLDAMRNGHLLVLDEINAMLPEVAFTLHSLLDDDRFLVIAEHKGEIVRPHPNFRLVATMNPSMEYSGTKDLNKALLSRFPIVIQTQYPEPLKEVAILKNRNPQLTDQDAALMVRIAEEIRKGRQTGSLSFICSTRDLIHWAELKKDLDLRTAGELAILNKCELATDRKTCEDVFKMHIGKWTLPVKVSLSELLTEKEQTASQILELEKNKTKLEETIAANDKTIQTYISQEFDLKQKINELETAQRESEKETQKLIAAAQQAQKGKVKYEQKVA